VSCGNVLLLLFEPGWQQFRLKALRRGFRHTHTDPIFAVTNRLFGEASRHVGDDSWYSLIVQFIVKLHKYFRSNRLLLPLVDRHDFLVSLSALPSIAEDLERRLHLVNSVLRCFCSITTDHSHFRKKLVRWPMETITRFLSGQQFGLETVNLMLELAFETDISIENPPEFAELANAQIPPFLHESTKHMPLHRKVFEYIATICVHSISNQLAIFRSDFLICILRYIHSFPSPRDISEDQYRVSGSLVSI
jgi:hypothetical protein